ncbi:hypothetical protein METBISCDRAFT_28988 [Metschnikowia bicuspidata]|uniref:Uncharacterized protein n=1 Tax=Metschnikowia bicuspidata TaxID=27322 RepID=A0A4P9Z7I6_9ASCO|nr:hypothetical protein METBISCDRAFT_28988 [Metschnikowia bicuspidata]
MSDKPLFRAENSSDKIPNTPPRLLQSNLFCQPSALFEHLEGNIDFVGGSVSIRATEHWENWFDEKAINYGGM